MSRVLFRVSYSIPDGKRSEYLKLIGQIARFYDNSDVQFSVFEDRSKHNFFQEVYVYADKDAYEASDDPDATKDIADQIEQVYALAEGVKYDVADEIGA